MKTLGLHLQQSLELVATPRPSVLAQLDATATLVGLESLETDEEIVDAIGDEAALVAIDAAVAVPNRSGQRDVERVLGWCDVPMFPVSADRLEHVHGGHRAARLVRRIGANVTVHETVPDLALRLMEWLGQTGGGLKIDLADYRARWIAVRAPRYRPKGAGRANVGGIAKAAALLADHVDLAGWRPQPDPDDWDAIRDAATIDAIAAAWVAWRATATDGGTRLIGTPIRGEVLIPVDANLSDRVDITLDRLRADGAIAI